MEVNGNGAEKRHIIIQFVNLIIINILNYNVIYMYNNIKYVKGLKQGGSVEGNGINLWLLLFQEYKNYEGTDSSAT